MTLTEQFDKIKEQEWFQQLKNSYDQLGPEQQNYVKWGTLGAGFLILGYLTWTTMQSANSAKDEYFQKQDLVQMINQATDETRRLKGQNSNFSQNSTQNWKTIFQGICSQVGMTPDQAEVTKESPGASINVIQETLLEVKLKTEGVRPLVQFLYQVEHGNPPMKLKGMTVKASADGTLNSNLNISGYLPKPDKGEKTK